MYRYIWKLCIIMLAVLPVYLVLRRPWKRESGREWAVGGFWLFMAALTALALEGQYGNPVRMAEDAMERIVTGERINLVPFRTIGSFYRHFIFDVFMVNIVGNIVMFIPWGFGLPLLWKRRQPVRSVMLCSLALPLCIESCQLFIGRSVDIDDLILNFAGGCLGAGIYFIGRKWFPGARKLAR